MMKGKSVAHAGGSMKKKSCEEPHFGKKSTRSIKKTGRKSTKRLNRRRGKRTIRERKRWRNDTARQVKTRGGRKEQGFLPGAEQYKQIQAKQTSGVLW